MKVSVLLSLAAALCAAAQPHHRRRAGRRAAANHKRVASYVSEASCFPQTKRDIPTTPATKSSLHPGWWCPQNTEFAFMGFSYDVTACPSQDQLLSDFKKQRETYNARYVRIYSACDDDDFNDNLVEAAAGAGLGVYALVWFGFDGTDQWKTRMQKLMETVENNPKAPYVIRNIAVGSEPLYDGVLAPDDLAEQIKGVKDRLSKWGIQATISEISFSFEDNDNAPAIFDAMDLASADVLPYMSTGATDGSAAWPKIQAAMEYFQTEAPHMYLRITQTGWPSNTDVWKSALSADAVADTSSEEEFFNMLDEHCEDFKKQSVGWFAHIYEDDTLPGWGIVKSGKAKFAFQPRTHC